MKFSSATLLLSYLTMAKAVVQPPPEPCTKQEIELEATDPESGTPFDTSPIEIISQDTETVTLKLKSAFSSTVSTVYVEYEQEGHLEQCAAFVDFKTDDEYTITALCMQRVPITVVSIYVTDENDAVSGNAIIPTCCHAPDGWVNPVVEYTFKVYCIPQCEEEESTTLGDPVRISAQVGDTTLGDPVQISAKVEDTPLGVPDATLGGPVRTSAKIGDRNLRQ